MIGEYVPPTLVSVNVHMFASTVIESTVYAAQNRVTVTLDGRPHTRTDVTLFADRAELVRLRDALSALVSELDANRAALPESQRPEESAA